jgi:hypothetical protein
MSKSPLSQTIKCRIVQTDVYQVLLIFAMAYAWRYQS